MKKLAIILFIFSMILIFWFFTYVIGIALAGSVMILLLGWRCWPETWRKKFGLEVDNVTVFTSLVLLVITLPVCFFIIRTISLALPIPFKNGYTFRPVILQTIGQTFNEELVCGLGLLALKRKLKGRYLLLLSITSALLFSAAHFTVYALNLVIGYEIIGGILSWLTLLNLFLAGLLRHSLILYTGRIFHAWAIHFGWNAIFFGGFVLKKFNEPELFNTFIGTGEVLLFLVIIITLSSGIILFSRKKQQDTG